MNCRGGVVAVVGVAAARVVVDGQAELLARRPQRLVAREYSGGDVGVVGDGREQDAAGEPVRRPTHRASATAPSTSLRKICAMPARRSGLGAPVGQPAVVGAQAGPAAIEVRRRRRRPGDERAGGEERRHRVGEDDLGDDAVGLELGDAAVAVPVAVAAVALQIAERVAVRAAPRVELVAARRLEVLGGTASIDPPAWQSAEITT